jgi:hypothetical protein
MPVPEDPPSWSTRHRRSPELALALSLLIAACGAGDGSSPDPGSEPADAADTGDRGGADAGGTTLPPEGDGGAAGSAQCDLSGEWIVQHTTVNVALGTEVLATNWSYHRYARSGDAFEITESLDCGYVVRGASEVSLSDDTLEAMALQASNGIGTRVRFAPTADGARCALQTDRIYSIRGANKARFLDATWQVGDPDLALSEFELPVDAAGGMEDWDHDGHEGITQLTSFGDRYTSQLDWHALRGEVEAGADQFGGDGVIAADYDAFESVSTETEALLRTVSTPMPPGYGWLARVDDALDTEPDDARRELAICRQVQTLAIERFGDPPRP